MQKLKSGCGQVGLRDMGGMRLFGTKRGRVYWGQNYLETLPYRFRNPATTSKEAAEAQMARFSNDDHDDSTTKKARFSNYDSQVKHLAATTLGHGWDGGDVKLRARHSSASGRFRIRPFCLFQYLFVEFRNKTL